MADIFERRHLGAFLRVVEHGHLSLYRPVGDVAENVVRRAFERPYLGLGLHLGNKLLVLGVIKPEVAGFRAEAQPDQMEEVCEKIYTNFVRNFLIDYGNG